MSDDARTGLLRVMAWSLADDNPAARRGPIALDDLAQLVTTLAPQVWLDRSADVLLCWVLRQRTPPPAILDAALAHAGADQTTLEGAANAWAVRALAAQLHGTPLPPRSPALEPPADRGWEAVGDWFARTAAMALPGRGDVVPADCAPELLRALAHALVGDDLVRAGGLLRWLAIAPTPVDRPVANALAAALERTRAYASLAFPTLAAYALWGARGRKKLGDAPVTYRPVAAHAGGAPVAIVDPAIDWLARHLDHFTPQRASFRKLGELGLLGDLMIREGAARGRTHWRDTGERFLQWAWRELDEGRLLERAVADNPTNAVGVTVYWPFQRHGLRAPALEQAIAQAARAIPQPLAFLAALPMRAMGLPAPWTVDEAFTWSVVGRAQPPWRLSSLELYLMTHIAFYDVEFRGPGESLRGREYLSRWLPVWLRHCEDQGLYDLLAEMIVVWHCAEDVCCPPRAWETLQRVQRSDGSVPFSRAGKETDDYHSTLATVMAALWCRHGMHG